MLMITGAWLPVSVAAVLVGCTPATSRMMVLAAAMRAKGSTSGLVRIDSSSATDFARSSARRLSDSPDFSKRLPRSLAPAKGASALLFLASRTLRVDIRSSCVE